MGKIRTRLTFANVVSCLALFIALGGASYAAIKLPKNSVGTKQLRKNAVTKAKIKKNAVTGAKIKANAVTGAKVKESSLGPVPSADHATSADSATTASELATPEAPHVVGASGEPAYENGFHESNVPLTFYKDHACIVHLEGKTAGVTGKVAFSLPPAFRPTQAALAPVAVGGPEAGNVQISATNGGVEPFATGEGEKNFGIYVTFRAAVC